MKPLVMRWASVFVSGALLFSSGYAAELEVAATVPMVVSPAGSSVLVDALITNSTTNLIFLTGVSSEVSEEFATGNLFDEFRAARPSSLRPGESWEGPVLRLTLAPNAPIEYTEISVSFVGGDHPRDDQTLGSFTFTLNDPRVEVPEPTTPVAFGAMRAWPNPMRGSSEIAFELATPSQVEIRVYDVRGAVVRTLVDGFKSAGSQSVVWDGQNRKGERVHPGVYFLKLHTRDGVRKTKVVRID